MTNRVLIYRLGSLGDTVVALPALHLIARYFVEAERRVLTNYPVSAKAPPMAAVLGNSGLVDGYFRYPVGVRSFSTLWRLREQIAIWGPHVCVYLAQPRGRLVALRDLAFLWSCGIRRVIGLPLSSARQNYVRVGPNSWEAEAERLVRCITELGDACTATEQSWSLGFSEVEQVTAVKILKDWPGSSRYVAFSIGTKADANDWGDENWRAVLECVGAPDLGLVLIGASDEAERSSSVCAAWPGPKLNLCGRVTPRISALVMRQAMLFLGHDSGPMHLAAAMGTRCVVVFSARNRPGIWFPRGRDHSVFYNKTDCFGCGLTECVDRKKQCIAGIQPCEVVSACADHLAENQVYSAKGQLQ